MSNTQQFMKFLANLPMRCHVRHTRNLLHDLTSFLGPPQILVSHFAFRSRSVFFICLFVCLFVCFFPIFCLGLSLTPIILQCNAAVANCSHYAIVAMCALGLSYVDERLCMPKCNYVVSPLDVTYVRKCTRLSLYLN